MTPVRIEVPARPPYVATVRLAVACLARMAGVSEGRVEDIRIAVGEVCADEVVRAGEAGRLEVCWEVVGGRAVVSVGAPAGPTGAPAGEGDEDERPALSAALVRELADAVAVEVRPSGGSLTRIELALSDAHRV